MQATTRTVSDMDPTPEKLQQYVSWLSRDPGNTSLYRQCAEAATTLRRFDVLLEIADRALESRPDDPALRFDRANACIGLRDYRAALTALAGLETKVSSSDQHSAITANRGLCHYCLGEFEQALPHLKSEYERGQRSASLLFMLVRSHHYLSQMDEAVALAKQNSEPAGRDAALAGAYALLFLDAEDAGSASVWAATALRLDPRSVDGGVTEGTLAIMRLQTDRAQRLFNSVLEVAPETARAWIGLGTLAMLQRDLPQAESHFARGLKQMPGFVGGWHMLGWSQLLRQDLANAEQSFNQALALDRNFAESHGALAALDAMRGDVASARHRLNVAKRLDPNCMSAQFAAALLEDSSLQGAQSQQILQNALGGLASQHQSALGRLLVKRPNNR